MLGTLGRFEEAIRTAQKGMEVRERILRRTPDDHRLRLYHAIACSNMGVDWADLGNLPEAVKAYERARGLLEQLARQEQVRPELADHSVGAEALGQLGITYYNLGNQLTNLDRPGEASGYYEKCRALQQRLVRENPTVPAHKEILVRACTALAGSRRLLREDPSAARRAAEEARDLSEQLLREDPKRAVNLTLASSSWEVLGAALARLGQRDETRAAMARAREYCDRQTAQAPKEIATRWSWSSHHGQWAAIHREWREPAKAAAATRSVRALWPREPTQLVGVARQFALCIPLVGKGQAARTTAERAEQQKYGDEAMEALHRAVKHGFKDVELLQKTKDLDQLRPRPDFQELARAIQRKK